MPVTAAAVVPFSAVVTAKPMPELKFIRPMGGGFIVTLPPAGINTQNATAEVPSVGVPDKLKNST